MSTQRVREQQSETTQRTVADDRETLPIDRQAGSGSLSAQEAWVSETTNGGPNDGRSITRTTFYATDVDGAGPPQQHRDPADRRSWAELAKWNDGMWDPGRFKSNFEADVKRWSQTFCGELDLNSYETDRVEYIITHIDLSAFKQHRLSTEKIILAVISLVIDAETTVDDIEEWDISEWIIYDDRFEGLMADLEMDRDELWTARKLVYNETDFFDDA